MSQSLLPSAPTNAHPKHPDVIPPGNMTLYDLEGRPVVIVRTCPVGGGARRAYVLLDLFTRERFECSTDDFNHRATLNCGHTPAKCTCIRAENWVDDGSSVVEQAERQLRPTLSPRLSIYAV